MDKHHSYTSHAQNFNRGEKTLFVMMLLVVFACVFIPVWQAGENRSLNMQLQKSQKTMTALEEQHRMLQARVAKARMPETLSGNAIRQDMVFTRIAPMIASIIGSKTDNTSIVGRHVEKTIGEADILVIAAPHTTLQAD
ncbi:hypothetical protein [Parasphaerochaeta coccoides]|uniref:Uncharacterized protein n=1 Tax=Parasphaerochaeta coccoides (strain ATCC BAA-1237 / DSM 17374 / SPN1) TaxID=760011 RepID=F4GKW9_PARC1|nr:hypothetical protein [Parasphaerochaeta coccoides]AEC01882.1 hypothetical protein Spico_0654 [Parasphaerochaeta coccoides DSM 17374]